MISVYIVTLEGFQLKRRYLLKQITFTDLNAGSHTYQIATLPQIFTPTDRMTVDYVTKHLHKIHINRPGKSPEELLEIIPDYCKDAIIIVYTKQDRQFLS